MTFIVTWSVKKIITKNPRFFFFFFQGAVKLEPRFWNPLRKTNWSCWTCKQGKCDVRLFSRQKQKPPLTCLNPGPLKEISFSRFSSQVPNYGFAEATSRQLTKSPNHGKFFPEPFLFRGLPKIDPPELLLAPYRKEDELRFSSLSVFKLHRISHWPWKTVTWLRGRRPRPHSAGARTPHPQQPKPKTKTSTSVQQLTPAHPSYVSTHFRFLRSTRRFLFALSFYFHFTVWELEFLENKKKKPEGIKWEWRKGWWGMRVGILEASHR